MIHPDTCVKNTHMGLGVFAKRRLERGTILWISDDIDAKLSLEEYNSLDDYQRKKLDQYSFIDSRGRVVINWDESKFVNHSCAPNSTGIIECDSFCFALRTIEPDEEILEDYSHFCGHFKSFTCECGASNCRGYVSTVDSYRSELRPHLADIRPVLLSQSQPLLNTKSSERDVIIKLLYPQGM